MKLRRSSALAAVALTALALAAVPTISTAASGTAADDAIGTYYPISKNQRIMDTRSGLGAPKAALGQGKEIVLQVTGRSGVPAGVSAVALNLTGVGPTSSTFVTAYPSGATRPNVSSLNLIAGRNRANLITVPVGSDGQIRLYNNSGSVNLVADVMGFYAGTDIQATHGIGSQYFPDEEPYRLYDSRQDPDGAWYPHDSARFGIDYGVQENARIMAFAVNITAINPSANGYLVAWNPEFLDPEFSSVNYTTGKTVPNMAIVPTQRDQSGYPSFGLMNGPGTARTHVAIDIVGVFAKDETVGLRFTPLDPRRIIDTRTGTGGFKGTLGPASSRTFAASSTVATPETYTLVANTTGITPTSDTYLTVWEAGTPKPYVSNLNVSKGETAANSTFVNLSVDSTFSVFNAAGSLTMAMDVAGRFDLHEVAPLTPLARSSSTDERQKAMAEVTRSPIGATAQRR